MSSSPLKPSLTLASSGDVDVRKLVVDIKHDDRKSAPLLVLKKGEMATYRAIPNIEGGEFKWTASGGISDVTEGEAGFAMINAESAGGESTLKIEYTLDGVTATKTITVAVVELQIVECPENFAPSAEECLIRFNPGGDDIKIEDKARLVIRDKNDKVVLDKLTGSMDADENMEFSWDGKNSFGYYVDILNSPFKVHIEHEDDPEFRSEEQEIKIEIESIEVEVDGVEEVTIDGESFDAVDMNEPAKALEVSATVKVKKSDGSGAVTELPIELTFSFEDPSEENLDEADSYNSLGKKGNESREYWRKHINYSTPGESVDKSIIHVPVKTEDVSASRQDKGIARTMFLPSGVGGDMYVIKAAFMDYSEGDGEALAEGEADEFTVIRRVSMALYEMDGTSQISDNGTEEKIHEYYVKDTYVLYEAEDVVAIDEKYSVKYIGLWSSADEEMLDWSDVQQKIASETPSEETKRKALDSADPGHAAALAEVQRMADAWKDRITRGYMRGLRNWASDAGIPENSTIGVEFAHPKFNADAPDADSETDEWGDFPDLKIEVGGREIHPDKRWSRGQGLAYRNRAYVLDGLSEERVGVVIAHEIGHETKNHFQRELFGDAAAAPGQTDHSVDEGLMDKYGSSESFSDVEKEILRGFSK